MKYRRYAEYKDSGVEWLGELPAHWGLIPLKYGTSVELSNVDKKTVDDQQTVYLCNYLDVYRNERITADLSFMLASAAEEQIERLSLKRGDVIITKDSESPDDIGIPALVEDNLAEVVCGYHLALIRPVASIMDGRFLLRYFQGSFVRAYFAVQAVGMTRYGLGKSSITGTKVAVPPIEEQQAIAVFLNRETAHIDALIAKQERLIAVLQEKRQALISHAVTKGLNPDAPMKDSGVEWLGEVPAHWKLIRVGHISRVVRGQTPRPAGDPKFFDGDYIPWITVGEVTKDDSMYLDLTQTMLTELGEKHSRVFESGTLVLSNSGATLGIPKILRLTGCMNDGNAAFLDVDRNISIKYLYFYFLAITAYLRGYSQGMGQPNLNTTIIGGLILPKPSLAEQHQIVDHCVEQSATVDILITKIQGIKTQLLERRAALVSAAVTGKIDVTQ